MYIHRYTYIQYIYTYTYAWSHSSTEKESTYKHNEGKDPHPPAHQDEGLLGGKHIYMCTVWMPPHQALCRVADPRSPFPQVLVPAHRSPWGHIPTPAAGRSLLHTRRDIHTFMQWVSPRAGLALWLWLQSLARTSGSLQELTHSILGPSCMRPMATLILFLSA